MKKKILLCLLCGMLLVGVTGCGNEKESNTLKESSSSDNSNDETERIICNQQEIATTRYNADGNPKILETPLEQNYEGIYIFKDNKISEIQAVVTYKYDSDEISEEDIEKQAEDTIRLLEYSDAKIEFNHKKNKSIATVTLDYDELSEEEKEKTKTEGVTLDEALDKLNVSTSQYCYNPNNKEKVTTPKKLEGKYVEDISKEPTATSQKIYIFEDDKVTTYSIDEDGEILDYDPEEQYSYTYKDGILKIDVPAHDGWDARVDKYTVKSNYKGYDLVLLDYEESFRGNKSE